MGDWQRTGRDEWRNADHEGPVIGPVLWVEWQRGTVLRWAPNMMEPEDERLNAAPSPLEDEPGAA